MKLPFLTPKLDGKGEAGFTLFEVLVALFLLSLIFSALFASYTGTLQTTRNWEDTGKVFTMAQGAMERILRDLEFAYSDEEATPFTLEQDVINEKPFPRLIFSTVGPTNPQGQETPPAGVTSITYAVRASAEGGDFELARTESPEDGAVAGSDFVICRGLSALRYRFYDRKGREISDDDLSGKQSNPPASVVVELTLVNRREESKPFHFMTRVHPANLAPRES